MPRDPRATASETPPDPVDQALEESFPASDPPAWAAHGTIREHPDPPIKTPRRQHMASRLPTPFSFGEDSSFAAGPFLLMQREMSRLLDSANRAGGGGQGAVVPPRVDVRETENDFRITAELPGVAEEDVEVDLDDDLLTIRAEKKEEREVEKAD